MLRLVVTVASLAVFLSSAAVFAVGRVKEYGRATVEYRSEEVKAVASYEYSQRNHEGPWLLIEFAVQATPRIAIQRSQLVLMQPDEQVVPLATQPDFLADQPTLSVLMQNAVIFQRPLSGFFSSPLHRTINFFTRPGGTVSESFVTNLDDVAAGNLLFKSPKGSWPAGTYRLALRHEKAGAELPINLN
jgi:hypothetical protein